jgi:hypothetical protein
MNNQAQIVALRGFLDNMNHLAIQIKDDLEDLAAKGTPTDAQQVNLALLKENIDEAQEALNKFENPDITDLSQASEALKGMTASKPDEQHNPGTQPPAEVKLDPELAAEIDRATPRITAGNRNPDLNRGTVEIMIVKITGSAERLEHAEEVSEKAKPRTDGLTQADIDNFGTGIFSLDKAEGTGLN